MKKTVGLAVVVGLMLWLSGCAWTTQPAQRSETVVYQQFDDVKNNGKKNIYLITKGYGNHYWDTLRKGAVDAAAYEDCNLYIGGTPTESHLEILADLMREAVRRDADAIIVSPTDQQEIIEASQEVRQADIPLLYVDTIQNGNIFDVCFATDNMQAGRMTAKELLRLLYEAGHTDAETLCAGIVIGTSDSQTMLERIAGFQEYWSDHAPENWQVIEDIAINYGDIQLAEQQCVDFMYAYDELAGLIALNNGSTVGACRALTECGRSDLVLVGYDFSDEIATLIRDESYLASSIVQRQYDMGYRSVRQAMKLIAGETAEYRYVDTGILKVSAENIDSYYIQGYEK